MSRHAHRVTAEPRYRRTRASAADWRAIKLLALLLWERTQLPRFKGSLLAENCAKRAVKVLYMDTPQRRHRTYHHREISTALSCLDSWERSQAVADPIPDFPMVSVDRMVLL